MAQSVKNADDSYTLVSPYSDFTIENNINNELLDNLILVLWIQIRMMTMNLMRCIGWILNTAYAIIPKKNKYGLYDLYLSYNYYPWKNETYANRTYTLFLKNVSSFTFKVDDVGIMHLYLCISDPNLVLKDGKILTVCKEGIVQ